MKNTEIKYTVTATNEWRIADNGDQYNAEITGTAATLAAAKRKARADAQDFQNQAEISYFQSGERLYTERNYYGIKNDWKPTREFETQK